MLFFLVERADLGIFVLFGRKCFPVDYAPLKLWATKRAFKRTIFVDVGFRIENKGITA